MNIAAEFISHEERPGVLRLGKALASPLSAFVGGLLAGAIFGFVLWSALYFVE